MKISVLTIFPEMFDDFQREPVIARAVRRRALELDVVDIRSFAGGSFRHIDDDTYGGGAGMVMRAEPVLDALAAVTDPPPRKAPGAGIADESGAAGGRTNAGSAGEGSTGKSGADGGRTNAGSADEGSTGESGADGGRTNAGSAGEGSTDEGSTGDSGADGGRTNAGSAGEGGTDKGSVPAARRRVILLAPSGHLYTQKKARQFAALDHLILICGHYEGIDARVEPYTDDILSIGDYVLTGGELSAKVVMDSVVRLLPGVLRAESTGEESFENGLLEYPQYTKPAVLKDGQSIPDVLLSGDHEKIRIWRLRESLRRTRDCRPDMLAARDMSEEEMKILRELDPGE